MMWNKKAQYGVPKLLNFIISLVVLATGGAFLLVRFGVIGAVPEIPGLIMEIITVLAGILLFADGFMGSGSSGRMPKALNLLAALIVTAGGIVLLLSRFGVLTAIPDVPNIILQSLLLAAGVLLLLDAIIGVNEYWS